MSTVDVTLFLSEDLLIKQVCPESNPFECISSRSLLNRKLPDLLVRNEELRREEEPTDDTPYENGKEFSGILKLEQHPPRDSYHVQCRYVQLAATEHLPYNSLITMKIKDKEKEARDHVEGMIEKSQGVSQLLHETRIAKARLNCLTEGIRHAIVVEDRDRRVVVANDRFKECFGIPLFVDLVGSDCSDGLAAAKDLFVDGEKAIKRVEDILRNREGVYGEEVLMSNGTIYERDYSPIFIDNTYEGHLWLYHDITSLKLYSLVSSINLLGQMLISSSTSKIFDSVPKFLQEKFRFRAVAMGLSENDCTAVKLVSSVGFSENDTDKIKATMLETISTKTKQLRQGMLHCVLMSSSDHGVIGALLVELKDKEDGHHQILNNIGSLLADTILRERWRDELSEARDRALAAVKAKSQFMANLSHELRTPLSVVLGLCDLLSQTALNAEQHDYVVNIQKSSGILFNVINQILDFSKSEASVIGVNEARFSPRSKIEDIMMMMSSHAEANKLKMNFYLPSCFDKEVIGDSVKLEQIMINLLGNAIKFTKKGGITLQGELVRSDVTEQEWKIEVIDTGIGVDEASSSKLFQPFTQLDGSSSRKYGGTGLGLAISKLLVEKLGGQIGHCNVKKNGTIIGSNFWFTFKTKPIPFHDAEPARFLLPADMCVAIKMKDNCHTSTLKRYLNEWGATIVDINDHRRCVTFVNKKTYSAMSDSDLDKETFIVLTSHPKVMQTTKSNIYFTQMPYIVANLKMILSSAFNKAPVPSVQSDNDTPKVEAKEKSDKILVVEDNVMNRKVIVKLLEKEGYKNVLWAENGLEALKLFNEHLFSLVFMDCQMPLMDGYEATRQIRKIENSERHVPIIALTANASEQDSLDCLAAGMDEYLAKPINQRALSQALKKIKS